VLGDRGAVVLRGGVVEFAPAAELTIDVARGWQGGPWPAAVAEARADLLLAEGDQRAAADTLRRAARGLRRGGPAAQRAPRARGAGTAP
jgi:hypothetical protein